MSYITLCLERFRCLLLPRAQPRQPTAEVEVPRQPTATAEVVIRPVHPPGSEPQQSVDARAFEEQANSVKRVALLIAILQNFSRVVGIMALTWATAVVLGGFAGDVTTWDFKFVSILMLLQSLRLFVTETVAKINSCVLFREHRDPDRFQFTDRQPHLHGHVSRVGSILGGLFAFVCLICTGILLSGIFYEHSYDNTNITLSIKAFYILALISSAIAFLSFVLYEGGVLWLRTISSESHDNSLATFYNTIYKTGIDEGIAKAEELRLLEFGFSKMAGELERNIRPLVVQTLNSRMLKFLYSGNGIAMVCAHMSSDDLYKVTAATNIPGFWREEQSIKTHQDLFWGMRKRVSGAGNDAIGALNSMTSLARHWSNSQTYYEVHPFLIEHPFDRSNILDTFVGLVLMPHSFKLLFSIRALAACCRDRRLRAYLYKQSSLCFDAGNSVTGISRELQTYLKGTIPGNNVKYENVTLAKLCKKLADLVQSPRKVRLTSRIYAANALQSLLLHGDNDLDEAFKRWWQKVILGKITLSDNKMSYFVMDDVAAAEEVLMWLGLEGLDWSSVTVRDLGALEDDRRTIPATDIHEFVKAKRDAYQSERERAA